MDSRDTKGLSPAALRATQGECSATSPKVFLKFRGTHGIHLFNRFHCVFIHAPSFARSSATMPVLLPSGMALFFTAWVSICCA